MAIIRNENEEVFYTNSEYFDKQKSDNMVICALLGSIVVGFIFYMIFYPFFNVAKEVVVYSSSEIKDLPHYASIITLIIGCVIFYRAKKKDTFFTDRVLFLPVGFAVFLSATIYIQSINNEMYGEEYSFSKYFNTQVTKKDINGETNFDKMDKFFTNLFNQNEDSIKVK